jgi:hypothetical protein
VRELWPRMVTSHGALVSTQNVALSVPAYLSMGPSTSSGMESLTC